MTPEKIKKLNEEAYLHCARWECELSTSKTEYVACTNPATIIGSFTHQDGDRESRRYCEEHALQEKVYWAAQDYDAHYTMEDIENFTLQHRSGNKVLIRVGRNVKKDDPNLLSVTLWPFE